MDFKDELNHWGTEKIIGRIWWCGDEYCDCYQPVIEKITPNHKAGYPWINRERLWEGTFKGGLDEAGDMEKLKQELRDACRKFNAVNVEDREL